MSSYQQQTSDRSTSTLGSKLNSMNPKKLAYVMRALNIGVASLLTVTGVFALINVSWNLVYILFAMYTILLSVMLFLFEIRFKKIDSIVAENFGFMFSWSGRSFFFFFMAAMVYGLQPQWLSVITFIVTVCAVCLNVFILCSNPAVGPYLQRKCSYEHEFIDNADILERDNANDIGKGVDFAAANPKMTKKAVTVVTGNERFASEAVNVAVNNPDQAKTAAILATKQQDVVVDVLSNDSRE